MITIYCVLPVQKSIFSPYKYVDKLSPQQASHIKSPSYFQMIQQSSVHLEALALRKFGLHVPESQRGEVIKQIKANSSLKEQFQKIQKSLETVTNEDAFFNVITSSHDSIAEIPENLKVIQMRDSTFLIRAINPEQIESLTERAFFNSFSLERIMNKEKVSLEQVKKPDSRVEVKNIKEAPQPIREENIGFPAGKGKEKETQWIQCANEGKCRGDSWYTLESSGLAGVKIEDLEKLNFICDLCKRTNEEESEISKRVKKN